MEKLWQDEAWEAYLYWQTQDKKTLKKSTALFKTLIEMAINAKESRNL